MNAFNPQEIAKQIVLRCVQRKACHFSVAVESVRISDVARLASGYTAFQSLLDSGKLAISDSGILTAA